MRKRLPLAAMLAIVAICGCGKPTLYPVSGEVKIASTAAPGVRVFFWAESYGPSTPSTQIGVATTGADGRFTITSGGGEPGLERGTYRVTFSRPIVRGKTFAASERPDGAIESVPKTHSDHENPRNSPVKASVPTSGDLVFDIPVNR